MVDKTLPVICRSCNKTVNISQIQFDEYKKAYVCNSCANESKKFSNIIKSDVHSKVEPKVSSSKKITYTCPNCKFEFSKDVNKLPNDCPYCGGKILHVKNNFASRIIKDSE